jgi:molybdate transport system regulatory protein
MDELMLRVSLNRDHFLGPGKIRLLELIDQTGSISAAARLMAMSYRRAWLLVDSMNAAFRAPVVIAAIGGKQGGGAAVTAFGREVIGRFRRMEETARKAIAPDLAALRSRAKIARGSTRWRATAPPRASRTRPR